MSNEREIVSSEINWAKHRAECSLEEVNKHEWAGDEEKSGTQTRERGVEENDVFATLPHSSSDSSDRQRQWGLWQKRMYENMIQAWQAISCIAASVHQSEIFVQKSQTVWKEREKLTKHSSSVWWCCPHPHLVFPLYLPVHKNML